MSSSKKESFLPIPEKQLVLGTAVALSSELETWP